MFHRLLVWGLVFCGLLLASAGVVHAALVRADFNDLTLGDLDTQSGGTGWSSAWSGNTTVDVVSGDLTAPASTNFELTQLASTPLSTLNTTNTGGGVTRSFVSPISGDIWFSFLLNPTHSASRGGVDLTAATGGDYVRVIGVGDHMTLYHGSGTRVIDFGASSLSVDTTALILGRIEEDFDGSNERISLWLNPDVRNLTTTIGPTFQKIDNFSFLAGGTGVGSAAVESYGSGGGGIVDFVTISDSYAAVTGVPEPSTLAMLLGLAGIGLLGWMRRRQ